MSTIIANTPEEAGAQPFACDMTALTREERSAHLREIKLLFGTLLRETRELENGYAFRFDGEHLRRVSEFITKEQLCCPFFSIALEVAPQRGALWLRLTGEGPVKPFITAELGLH